MDFVKRVFSILWCFFRLIIVLIIAFFSSLNKILFDNMEIISVSLIMRPQAPERSTMGFINKLCYNNRELTKGAIIPKSDAFDENDPFLPDDLMVEEEQENDETFGEESPPLDDDTSPDNDEGESDDGQDNNN